LQLLLVFRHIAVVDYVLSLCTFPLGILYNKLEYSASLYCDHIIVDLHIVVMQKSDTSFLAQFYYADEQLNCIAAELDSFDGRKDPERCTSLVNQLRHSQDEVLSVIDKIMCAVVPERSRACRDYRVKFPDDVLHESLAGQLWFGAEVRAVQLNNFEIGTLKEW